LTLAIRQYNVYISVLALAELLLMLQTNAVPFEKSWPDNLLKQVVELSLITNQQHQT